MNPSFQLLHFVVDPFTREKLPLGAVVRTMDGAEVVVTDRHAGPACLGGVGTSTLFRMLTERLRVSPGLSDFSKTLGPHVVSGPEMVIPAGFEGAAADWVRAFLSVKHTTGAPLQLRAPAVRRDSAGARFFQTYKVKKYVKSKYRGPDARRRSVDPITHWVSGAKDLLLMEPILGAHRHYEEELREVAQRFFAWRTVLAKKSQTQSPIFVAYVFPGHRDDAVAAARELLAQGDAQVVDVDNPEHRDEFLARIVEVARSGTASLQLH